MVISQCFSHIPVKPQLLLVLVLVCGLLMAGLLFVHLLLSRCTAVFISPQSLYATPPILPSSLPLHLCLRHSTSQLCCTSLLFFFIPPLTYSQFSHQHTLYGHTYTALSSLLHRITSFFFSIPPPPRMCILFPLNLSLPPFPLIHPDITPPCGLQSSVSSPCVLSPHHLKFCSCAYASLFPFQLCLLSHPYFQKKKMLMLLLYEMKGSGATTLL